MELCVKGHKHGCREGRWGRGVGEGTYHADVMRSSFPGKKKTKQKTKQNMNAGQIGRVGPSPSEVPHSHSRENNHQLANERVCAASVKDHQGVKEKIRTCRCSKVFLQIRKKKTKKTKKRNKKAGAIFFLFKS